MRFSKISITKKGVRLIRVKTTSNGAVEETKLESPEQAMPSFVDSLQGFKPYVMNLLDGALTVTAEKLTITTLSLSEDSKHLRGLIVTSVIGIAKAYGKPLVLNTPLVREGTENSSAEAFVLTDEVMELISLAEREATAYVKGDRQQLELPMKADSANTKAVDERMASASVQSTRKPHGRANGKVAGEIGPGSEKAASEKFDALSTKSLRQLLLMVERDVPEEAIDRWTSSERESAQRWAVTRQKELAGTLADARVPREPKCLIADATKTLADGWTQAQSPPRAESVAPAGVEGKAGRRTHPHIH